MTRYHKPSRQVAAGMRVACVIPERGDSPLYLYAIRRPDTGEVKLGVAEDPCVRMATLQIAHGAPLELAMAVPAVLRDESAAHALFADCRLMGEWFRETPALTAWIIERMASVAHLPPLERPVESNPQCAHITTKGRRCAVDGNRTILVRVAGSDDGFLWSVCTSHLQYAMREFRRVGLTCSDPDTDRAQRIPSFIEAVRRAVDTEQAMA